MKKALTITLACVLAAGVLGGCSGKGGENMTEGVTGGTVKLHRQKPERKRRPRARLPEKRP